MYEYKLKNKTKTYAGLMLNVIKSRISTQKTRVKSDTDNNTNFKCQYVSANKLSKLAHII